MQTVLILALFPLGLIAGGFATMLADRGLDDTPFSLRSRCPHCHADLSLVDTIPIVSWFRLGRSCRHCGAPITKGYPLVELGTAILFAWVAWRYDQTDWLIIVPLIFVVAAMALTATDLYTYRLPNRIVFPAFWVSLVAMVILAVVERNDITLVIPAVLCGVAYFLFLFIVNLIYPPAMGFGDVKLSLLLGLHAGWVASVYFGGGSALFQLTFWTIVIGHVMHLVFAVPVSLLRRKGIDVFPDPEADPDADPTKVRGRPMPMGPALIVGALFVILYPATVIT